MGTEAETGVVWPQGEGGREPRMLRGGEAVPQASVGPCWHLTSSFCPTDCKGVNFGCPEYSLYGENWTIKKAEHRRMDAFEQWCWRKLLRVPWTARGSNQSILKKTSPEYSLEELMLKLKLQYFGHLMQRANSLEKTLMLGKMEGRRRGREDEMVGWHHQVNGHGFEQTPGAGDGRGGLACCSPWGLKESDTT